MAEFVEGDAIFMFLCGECMNSSEFRTRVIVPREGRCESCGRADNGKVWELGGVTRWPKPNGSKQAD